jgi:hypothetical protein
MRDMRARCESLKVNLAERARGVWRPSEALFDNVLRTKERRAARPDEQAG